MKAHAASQRTGQRGVGLIEVMIALTVGLVLLIGAAQYFISMRSTASSAQQLSALQNQQRMAMYFLHVAVAGAGYNPDPFSNSADSVYPSNSTFPVSAQTLMGSGAAVAGSSDTLIVRFVASGAEQGCAASLTAGSVYTDTFTVSTDGYLQCSERNDTAGTTAPTLKLIGNNVKDMQIQYGVDTQNSFSAQQYMSADQVTAANMWGNVMTAQITLRFTNPLAGQFGLPSTALMNLTETIPYMTNI